MRELTIAEIQSIAGGQADGTDNLYMTVKGQQPTCTASTTTATLPSGSSIVVVNSSNCTTQTTYYAPDGKIVSQNTCTVNASRGGIAAEGIFVGVEDNGVTCKDTTPKPDKK